jgi:hypothetical protein
MDASTGRCACGARLVGEPLFEPLELKPSGGAAAGALALALLSATSLWARPALVLAPIALLLGARALRAARRHPTLYGGRRTASAAVALASLVFAGVGGYLVAGIPGELRRREESRAAATRAEMYHLAGALQRYHARYGAYPARLGDLSRLGDGERVADTRDSWQRKIAYTGYNGGLASAARPSAISTSYELRSPGPDGIAGTPDDLIMRDGLIVDPGDADRNFAVDPAETMPVPLDGAPRRRSAAEERRGWSNLNLASALLPRGPLS